MNKQKRFKKQTVNNSADKGMEQGAKTLKGILCIAPVVAIAVKNKVKLKPLGKRVGKFVLERIIKL